MAVVVIAAVPLIVEAAGIDIWNRELVPIIIRSGHRKHLLRMWKFLTMHCKQQEKRSLSYKTSSSSNFQAGSTMHKNFNSVLPVFRIYCLEFGGM